MKTIQQHVIESTSRPRSPTKLRLTAIGTIALFAMITLIGRCFQLQITRGSFYLSLAEQNRVDRNLIPAPRGILYDRNGERLVENISSTDLIFDPVLIPSEENEAQLIENLARMLPNVEPKRITTSLSQTRTSHQPTIIIRALDHEAVLHVQESRDSTPGVHTVSSLVRKYLHSYSTSHVLGYTNAVTKEELEKDSTLSLTDTTGKQGIERTYDKQLRGQHGYHYVEVNAAGRPQTDLGTEEPTPGTDLHLTLDIDLQNFIYGVLSEKDNERAVKEKGSLRGASIALDPRTGEVIALVSYPAFDQNVFSQPQLQSDAAHVFNDPNKPLFNRAVDGSYPPGSIIKPFLAAVALEEDIITEYTTVLSTGGISIGPWHFADWKAGGHGTTDVRKAIAESVNTFFYVLTGGDTTTSGLGVKRATRYLQSFGWSQKTGIDLPTEAEGFLPSPEWKKETYGESWYIGDTYHLGIGQGNVLVSPLQISVATASLANGGKIHQPHIVNNKKYKTRKVPLSKKNIAIAASGMRQVITDGSGKALSSISIPLAGKTGTAEIGGTENTHAWFTSYGPYDDPQLVVTVLLEEGGEGEKDAIPIAKDIWNWWIEHRLENKETIY